MKINLQSKFFLISCISILCISLLAYNGYTSLLALKDIATQVDIANRITFIQAKSINKHDAIRGIVDSKFLERQERNQENIEDLNNNINEYISDLQSLIFSDLPKNIHDNITDLNTSALRFIDDARISFNNSNSVIEKSRYTSFNQSAIELNNLNNLLTNQVIKFAIDLQNKATIIRNNSIQSFATTACLSIFFTLLAPIFTSISIIKPQARMTNVMYKILAGQHHQKIPYLSRNDELGSRAQALDKFRLNSIKNEELKKEAEQLSIKMAEEKKKRFLTLSNNFEESIKQIVDMLATSSIETGKTARELEQDSAKSQYETEQFVSTLSQTNKNVQEISKATDKFTNSVNEISSQVHNSREYTLKASEQTEEVNNVVLELENKAKAISGIIDIINNINSQIDLLALNATIEAARAGEMGKGFAVVANEVKALATQTAKATDQINIQISEIQFSTAKAVVSIQEVTESVKTITHNTNSITSAIEEQSSTSSYISDNIAQIASISNTMNNSTEEMSQASIHSGKAASQMVKSMDSLSKESSHLQEEVNKFLANLKS
jgi:methyl-accepting chemotaxis protein